MQNTTFTVNISSVKSFLKDRRRWLYEWVYNRVPRKGQKALTFGKILHLVFEEHFKTGVTMREAIEVVAAAQRVIAGLTVDPDERADILEALEDLETYREPLEQWTDQYPIGETLEVEEAFAYPHPMDPSIIIRGRPDRVALIFGKVFHIQNRSLAAGKNIGLYTELMHRDMHEMVYAWALRKKYPQYEYGGTLFNLMRKLKYRAKPTKKDPDGRILHELSEIMGQYAMPAEEEQIERALTDLLWTAREMQRTLKDAEQGILPSSSRDLDAGFFGNKKDAYFEVLKHGEHLLNDDTFKPREEMYANNNEVE